MTVSPSLTPYLDAFHKRQPALALEPPGLAPRRQAAIDRFAALGFPTVKDEAWRYLRLGSFLNTAFSLSRPASTISTSAVIHEAIDALVLPNSHAIVLVNGEYNPEYNATAPSTALPRGLRIRPLSAAFAESPELVTAHFDALVGTAESQHAFTLLNTAFATEGAVIELAADAVIDRPLQLLCLSTPSASPHAAFLRNLVIAGAYSRATLVTTYASVGDETALTAATTEFFLAKGAAFIHLDSQDQNATSFHLSDTAVLQAGDSHFSSHLFSLGARVSRKSVTVSLDAPGATAAAYGLYVGHRDQQLDHHVIMNHREPHGRSRTLYKGILDDASRGAFDGLVKVFPEARKTDAEQITRTILLSDDAEADPKPQLEILNDDVICAHGASVGQIDANALFYLRTRGIGESDARRLLTYAFARDVVDTVESPELRAVIDAQVRHALLNDAQELVS